MDGYNTPTIKNAVDQAVRDGYVCGNIVMDEPNVSGGAEGFGNTWGPAGTMTKARVDGMCAYAKAIWPTIPMGVTHRWDIFVPTTYYKTCEFIISQYRYNINGGKQLAWRDGGYAWAEKDYQTTGHRVRIIWSMNLMSGGRPDNDGHWDCKNYPDEQGEKYYDKSPLCNMSPKQIRDWGLSFGDGRSCGVVMWEYRSDFFGKPANGDAFRTVFPALRSKPKLSCRG
jgi:hypothetical protein